jgi:hypothetical protein
LKAVDVSSGGARVPNLRPRGEANRAGMLTVEVCLMVRPYQTEEMVREDRRCSMSLGWALTLAGALNWA